jgi:predicted exporter
MHGIDSDDTSVPVEKMDSIHLALSIAETKGCGVHWMDVKNAFLNGNLYEKIYME